MMKKAVVLLSGGADSTTVAAIAKAQGYQLYGLSINYGQRHAIELEKAKIVANKYCVEHKTLQLDLGMFGGSSLTDEKIAMPEYVDLNNIGPSVAVTYVPARNTIFLSFALAWAEVIGSSDIFIGPNKTDFNTYPDCRPDYISAFEKLSNLATRAGVHDHKEFKIHTPLIEMEKKDVIKKGLELGVDFSDTHSCYNPDNTGKACGKCSSCLIRKNAFLENGHIDPVL